MTHRYNLTLTVDETEGNVSLSGEFSSKEWKHLQAFVKYAEELAETEFIRSGEWGRLSINWEEGAGMEVVTVLPIWEQAMIFLYKLRPLILQNENTNFNKVRSMLARKLDHPYVKDVLRQQRDLYSGKHADVQIKFDGVPINSEKVLFDWLNSHEYHREEDKQEFIESLHGMMPLDASKVIFLGMLTDKARAIFNLAALIRVIIGEQQEVETNINRP